MSVLKSKRKPSQFEVFHHLTKMRHEVTDLLLRDFGYDADKAKKNVLRMFSDRPYEELNEEEKARYEKIAKRNEAFAEWFITDERNTVVNCIRSITMDDSYAIHESKEFLQELLNEIVEIAKTYGITVNIRKTRICKLSEHWRFLQVQYSLTPTGRIIQKISPKRLTAMRRKMKKVARKLTLKDFTDFYQSWFKNHYKIMSKQQRANMDSLYNLLKEVSRCTQ